MVLAEDILASPQALRSALLPAMRERTAVWLRLGGLGLDDSKAHASLCNELVRSGFGDEARPAPETLVLDWSSTDSCTAEGLAFFSVVGRHFSQKGCSVLACGTQNSALEKTLVESGVHQGSACAAWIPTPSTGQINCQSLAPAAIFGPDRNPSIDAFIDALSSRSRECGLKGRGASAVVGATNEFLQNVLSHGGASNAAAVALMFTRRRPPVLQIGIADDGMGIPASLVAQVRHVWMAEYSDVLAARAALRNPLSGRSEDMAGAFTGGGMARMAGRLVADVGATVTVRSGAALVQLSPRFADHPRMSRQTYGHGTQTRIEIPVR